MIFLFMGCLSTMLILYVETYFVATNIQIYFGS